MRVIFKEFLGISLNWVWNEHCFRWTKNYLNVPRRTLSWTVELEDTLEKIGL